MTLALSIMCDTPTSSGYTDYLEISYSTGGQYNILRNKIDENYISQFGTTFT